MTIESIESFMRLQVSSCFLTDCKPYLEKKWQSIDLNGILSISNNECILVYMYELERSKSIKIPLHKQFTRIRSPNIWPTDISFSKCVSDRVPCHEWWWMVFEIHVCIETIRRTKENVQIFRYCLTQFG